MADLPTPHDLGDRPSIEVRHDGSITVVGPGDRQVRILPSGQILERTETVDPSSGFVRRTERSTGPDGHTDQVTRSIEGHDGRVREVIERSDGSTQVIDRAISSSGSGFERTVASDGSWSTRRSSVGHDDTRWEVTQHSDGSVATSSERTVHLADGSVLTDTRAPDGTVQSTRVWPNGNHAVEIRTPAGTVTSSQQVQHEDGTTVVTSVDADGHSTVTEEIHDGDTVRSRTVRDDGVVERESSVVSGADGTMTETVMSASGRKVTVVRPDGSSDEQAWDPDGTVVYSRSRQVSAEGVVETFVGVGDASIVSTVVHPDGTASIVENGSDDGSSREVRVRPDGSVLSRTTAADGSSRQVDRLLDGSAVITEFDTAGQVVSQTTEAGDLNPPVPLSLTEEPGPNGFDPPPEPSDPGPTPEPEPEPVDPDPTDPTPETPGGEAVDVEPLEDQPRDADGRDGDSRHRPTELESDPRPEPRETQHMRVDQSADSFDSELELTMELDAVVTDAHQWRTDAASGSGFDDPLEFNPLAAAGADLEPVATAWETASTPTSDGDESPPQVDAATVAMAVDSDAAVSPDPLWVPEEAMFESIDLDVDPGIEAGSDPLE